VRKVRFREPPFEERARITPGALCGWKNTRSPPCRDCAREEVVEADFEQVGRAGVGRDVAAKLAVGRWRAHDHRQRVPAHERGELLLDGEVAGKGRLAIVRNVLTYGVTSSGDQSTCGSRARAASSSRMKRARAGPSLRRAQQASRHSAVSAASRSSLRG
jgi:hypothetical protein